MAELTDASKKYSQSLAQQEKQDLIDKRQLQQALKAYLEGFKIISKHSKWPTDKRKELKGKRPSI